MQSFFENTWKFQITPVVENCRDALIRIYHVIHYKLKLIFWRWREVNLRLFEVSIISKYVTCHLSYFFNFLANTNLDLKCDIT